MQAEGSFRNCLYKSQYRSPLTITPNVSLKYFLHYAVPQSGVFWTTS